MYYIPDHTAQVPKQTRPESHYTGRASVLQTLHTRAGDVDAEVDWTQSGGGPDAERTRTGQGLHHRSQTQHSIR
eukprot:7262984-Prymnesium_polylepis.1